MKKTIPMPEEPIDLSAERVKRCEPIAKAILQMLVDEKILLKDITFIEQIVKEQFEVMFKSITLVHLKTVFDLVVASLEYHVNRAKAIQWGKDENSVTCDDVDTILKRAAQATLDEDKVKMQTAQEKESES